MPCDAGASAIRKIYLRPLPIAIFTCLLAYVDRINASFAALTMRSALHMTAADFGFASGISRPSNEAVTISRYHRSRLSE